MNNTIKINKTNIPAIEQISKAMNCLSIIVSYKYYLKCEYHELAMEYLHMMKYNPRNYYTYFIYYMIEYRNDIIYFNEVYSFQHITDFTDYSDIIEYNDIEYRNYIIINNEYNDSISHIIYLFKFIYI